MAAASDLRDWILTLIENGMSPGEKLPGARRIAARFGCSLPVVQGVLDSLEQSGVVGSRARSGTFVREGFRDRLLPRNAVCGPFFRVLSDGQKKQFRRAFPDMHLSDVFRTGGAEILSTFTILSRQRNYQDLAPVFDACFPDCEKRFYMDSLKPFRIEGRLCAVPILFSPQILWYNPAVFREKGVPEPRADWGGKEFFSALRALHRELSGRRIINYSPAFRHWIGFILAAGGALFDPGCADPVRVDSPETEAACSKYLALLRELDLAADFNTEPEKAFAEGKMAMFAGFRQSGFFFRACGMDFTPGAVCMPDLGGGVNHQGAALLAFRKGIFSDEEIGRMLKFWLSPSLQETFGKSGYGVPFLRRAAEKTLDGTSEPDRTLLAHMPPLSSNYHICSEELGSIVSRSSALINTSPPGELPRLLGELGTVMRYIIKLKRRN